MNFSGRLMTTIWKLPALYNCKYKASNYEIRKILVPLKMALVAYTLWHNSCKTLHPQENICDRVHSYYNSNFTMHRGKLKSKTVLSYFYLIIEVFLHSSMEHDSGSACIYFKFWYCFLNDLTVGNTFLTFERRKQCGNLTSEIT